MQKQNYFTINKIKDPKLNGWPIYDSQVEDHGGCASQRPEIESALISI